MNDLELIGRLLENSYSHPSPSATYSIKHRLSGNNLELNYASIVHFASEQSLQQQLVRLREQAAQLVDDSLAKLKKDFRDSSGSTLRLEDHGGNDNLELISSTSNSPRKIAYFKYNRVVEIAS